MLGCDRKAARSLPRRPRHGVQELRVEALRVRASERSAGGGAAARATLTCTIGATFAMAARHSGASRAACRAFMHAVASG